jgi:hypothetical protein
MLNGHVQMKPSCSKLDASCTHKSEHIKNKRDMNDKPTSIAQLMKGGVLPWQTAYFCIDKPGKV